MLIDCKVGIDGCFADGQIIRQTDEVENESGFKIGESICWNPLKISFKKQMSEEWRNLFDKWVAVIYFNEKSEMPSPAEYKKEITIKFPDKTWILEGTWVNTLDFNDEFLKASFIYDRYKEIGTKLH